METEEIHEALQRLDLLLSSALTAFAAVDDGSIRDRFRGLYIAAEQARRLLHRPPGQPPFAVDADPALPLWPAAEGSFARRLADTYGLSAFDLDALLIALAPEFDLRYERLYAYLQDDVTRKRPTVDLVLNLLSASAGERLRQRKAFAADAPLRRQRIVDLIADSQQIQPPLLARSVVPDEQIVRRLAGDSGIDSRLALFARPSAVASFADLHVVSECREQLIRVAEAMAQGRLHAWLHGAGGTGHAAAAIARHAGAGLLAIDAARMGTAEVGPLLSLAMREAWLQDTILAVHAATVDAEAVAALLPTSPCRVIFTSEHETPAALRRYVATVHLPLPDAGLRAECWQAALARYGSRTDAACLEAVAGLFRLAPAQIEAAAAEAALQVRLLTPPRGGAQALSFATLQDCSAAARGQSAHLLDGLAAKIDARAGWADIVLTDDAQAQLHELCQRVAHRSMVLDQWGFAGRSGRGLGNSALFVGPSGTGKTLAAEAIANELGLDLYCIDLAGVVSKYIGETEKNLDRVFTAAERANAILFFDEADALFGKRSEVRDSHDRYANLEISYLLQRMERYEGITILATNLRQNLDEAFVRRLSFCVHFPFPDEAHRQRLWSGIWPAAVPLADDVDAGLLARQFKLSGGNIRNVALAAAFLAAAEGEPICREHVLQAAQRELQKMGKSLPAGDMAPKVTA